MSVATAILGATPVVADQDKSAFARWTGNHLMFETGRLLPKQTLAFQAGTIEGPQGLGGGTGRQYYGGELRWRGNGDLELGLALQVYDDPPAELIDGSAENITMLSFGPSVKYQYYASDDISLALQAAIEVMRFRADWLDTSTGESDDNVVASIQFPATVHASDHVQLHFNAGAAMLPNTLNEHAFYGTFFHAGGGVTWTPSQKLQFYGTAQTVFGAGGNVIEPDGTIGQIPVWSVGASYALNNRAALALFATNGVGFTPGTAMLTDLPGNRDPVFGVRLDYAPSDLWNAASVDVATAAPDANRHSSRDGITFNAAHLLPSRTLQFTTTAGSDGNVSALVAYSHDKGVQIEALVEDFANDGSVGPSRNPNFDLRYAFGGRLGLLRQDDGDPFTLSARLLAGRDFKRTTVGIFYAALPIAYAVNDQVSVHIDPRYAAFSDARKAGVGLGVNVQATQALQLLAEVTAVHEDEPRVWGIGARYTQRNRPFSVEIFATNAIGRYGLGTLVAQDSPRLGVSFTWQG